jgi:predicted secreted Zn-dependent protease
MPPWAGVALFALGCRLHRPPALALPPAPGVESPAPWVWSYPVRGDSAEALARAMARRGPRYHGERFAGTTRWKLRAAVDLRRSEGACEIAAHRVRLRTVMVLPRHAGARRAPPALRADFAAYLAALAEHERGHALAGQAAAAALAARLDALGPKGTCRRLRQALQEEVLAAAALGRAGDAELDRTTDHGGSTGVRWPP